MVAEDRGRHEEDIIKERGPAASRIIALPAAFSGGRGPARIRFSGGRRPTRAISSHWASERIWNRDIPSRASATPWIHCQTCFRSA